MSPEDAIALLRSRPLTAEERIEIAQVLSDNNSRLRQVISNNRENFERLKVRARGLRAANTELAAQNRQYEARYKKQQQVPDFLGDIFGPRG